jgi:hypothetical protein
MIAIGSQPGSADTPQTSAEPDDATANAAAADLPIQKPHPQT